MKLCSGKQKYQFGRNNCWPGHSGNPAKFLFFNYYFSWWIKTTFLWLFSSWAVSVSFHNLFFYRSPFVIVNRRKAPLQSTVIHLGINVSSARLGSEKIKQEKKKGGRSSFWIRLTKTKTNDNKTRTSADFLFPSVWSSLFHRFIFIAEKRKENIHIS